MKTLIIYASKTGTAKKCASLLGANLGAENCDIFSVSEAVPNLSDYDSIVIGSYVRMGVVDKKISAFLSEKREELLKMPLGLFLCGCLEDKVQEAIIKNFSEDFLEHAVCVDYFGGELHPENYKGIEKLFVKSITKISGKDSSFKVTQNIIPKAITSFSAELQR